MIEGGADNNFFNSRPAWLTEASVSVKESYDDNVFLAGAAHTPVYKRPPGSVAALKNQESWIASIAPRVGVNAAPVLHFPALDALSVGYAPEFVTFQDTDSESYNAHRVPFVLKGHSDNFSFSAENTFTFIDGETRGPVYPGSLLSAFATCVPRERREQWQDRAAVTFQFTRDKWFIRPTASLVYYDLMTEQINSSGYQNYADRYDVSGGADIGYKVTPPVAVTLGYRYGHQYQEQFAFSPYSTSGDYQRILAGLEGKPLSWLDVKLIGGPDFRSYPDDSPGHITPIDDKEFVTYYGEASVVATISTNDAVSFKYKQFLWVSSIGKVPYFDSTYELSYRRRITAQLSADLTGRLLNADYSPGNLPACKRDDWQDTVAIGASYTINTHASVNLAYSLDLGRNTEDRAPHRSSREFERNLVSLGATLKF